MKKHSAEDAKRILESESPLKSSFSQPGLRTVKNKYFGLKHHPKEFGPDTPAGVVFANLNVCYKNGGNVSEGCIEDIIWGFRQSGIPNHVTFQGIKDLKDFGYFNWTDEKGHVIVGDPAGSGMDSIWYQWTPKFFNLLLEKPDEAAIIESNIKIKDNTVEGLED